MDNNLTGKFGPCGLLCEKCFAYSKGEIKFHAEELSKHLGNFDNYARRFVTLLEQPIFAEYPKFKELLDLMASGTCQGCRKQECVLFKGCQVNKCIKLDKIEFCYQCADFPCDNTGFDDNLKQRWLKINNRIKETGLDSYYSEIKDKARY